MEGSGRGFLASARLLAVLTLASRLLGLARDMLMASVFGARAVLDAFVLAFTVPNLFRRLFGEGALSAAFIPVYAGTLEREGAARARELLSSVATLTAGLLVTIAATGVLACLGWRAWGALSAEAGLALLLTAILLPYLVFICLVAVASGALNTLGRFALPGAMPVLFNCCWLASILLLAPSVGSDPHHQIAAVAAGLTAAGALQLLVLHLALRRAGAAPAPRVCMDDPALRRVGALMGPMLFGAAVFQLNVLVDRMIAYWMIPGEGALSVLYLGMRVTQFPLGIIAVALGTAVFPLLARMASDTREGAGARYRGVFDEAIGVTLFLSVPASVGLLMVREDLVALFFERQAFDAAATGRTSDVLAIYAVGIAFTCVANLVTRALYSIEEVRLPVRVGMVAMLLNLVLNLALVGSLRERGLAIASVISQLVGTGLLMVGLGQLLAERGAHSGWGATLVIALRITLWSALMGLAVWFSNQALAEAGRTLRLAAAVGAGVLVYGAVALLFERESLRRLLRR